jgi:hypothetical protein
LNRLILRRSLLMTAMVLAFAIPAVAGSADTSTSQNVAKGVSQDSERDSESGDVGQAFEVTGSEDTFDQCAGVQGASNTAPLQGGINTLQHNSEANDFEFEDVGGSSLNLIQAHSKADTLEFDGGGGPLTVDGINQTSCDEQANQAGAASG